MYDYCKKFSIPHVNTKKLLVASSSDQVKIIDKINDQATLNGVEGIKKISKNEVSKLEPLITCEEALLVPSSGIIDAIYFMRSLVGQIEDLGGMISYKSNLKGINVDKNKFYLSIVNDSETIIECKELINSSGIYATEVAKKIKQ